MHLPNIFDRTTASRSKSAHSFHSSDDESSGLAPTSEIGDYQEKANEGWRRAIQTRNAGILKETSVGSSGDKRSSNRGGLKAAAFGFGKSTNNSSQDSEFQEEEIKKKAEEGWSRSQKVKPLAHNDPKRLPKEKGKSSIKSAVVGMASAPNQDSSIFSSDESLALEIEKKADEGMKRLKNVKAPAAQSEATSSHISKHRTNVLAAAVGISTIESSILGSSDSVLKDEIERKADEGLKRIKNLKGSLPESHAPANHSHRSNILAAAVGISNIESSILGSSDSGLADDIEKKAEDGLKRVQNLKNIPQTHEKHHSKPVQVRANVLAASVGITSADKTLLTGSSDSLLSDEAEKKASEGLERLKHMKIEPVHHDALKSQPRSQRPSILSAAMGLSNHEEQKPIENPKTRRLSLADADKHHMSPAAVINAPPPSQQQNTTFQNVSSAKSDFNARDTSMSTSDHAQKLPENPLEKSTKKLPGGSSKLTDNAPKMSRQGSSNQKTPSIKSSNTTGATAQSKKVLSGPSPKK